MAEPALFQTILGLKFYVGDMPGVLRLTRQGGLIVVPSAPVLVELTKDPAHRAAVEGSDFALTDSGFMVLLWRLFRGQRLPRISGLKYLRALVESPDFQAPGATFWIMPSAADAAADCAWLRWKGLTVTPEDCYLAPVYPAGPLADPALLALLEARRPQFIVICLGGGVQERLGFFLRKNLSAFREREAAGGGRMADAGGRTPEAGRRKPEAGGRTDGGRKSDLGEGVSGDWSEASAARRPPAIVCTGAAIAFLSGQQANIPVWADRFMLGWLLRSLHEPTKYLRRYWKALRLLTLLWQFGERPVKAGGGS